MILQNNTSCLFKCLGKMNELYNKGDKMVKVQLKILLCIHWTAVPLSVLKNTVIWFSVVFHLTFKSVCQTDLQPQYLIIFYFQTVSTEFYKLWYGFRLNKVLEINYDECTNANYWSKIAVEYLKFLPAVAHRNLPTFRTE